MKGERLTEMFRVLGSQDLQGADGSLSCYRLTGVGGRKKIFRLSDVVKPMTDAQIESMKLGAVRRILRAEKSVACSGAAQVQDELLLSPYPFLRTGGIWS